MTLKIKSIIRNKQQFALFSLEKRHSNKIHLNLIPKEKISESNFYFILIKLPNNQFIFEWFPKEGKIIDIINYCVLFLHDQNINNYNLFYYLKNNEIINRDDMISNICLFEGTIRKRTILELKQNI